MLAPRPDSLYPAIIVIDADLERGQRLARLLTLAHFRPLVASTPFQAFQRIMLTPQLVVCVMVGAIEQKQDFLLARLMQRLCEIAQRQIPLLPAPLHILDEAPLVADPALSTAHHSLASASMGVLAHIWQELPWLRQNVDRQDPSMALSLPPPEQMVAQITLRRRSRNSHFRQVLSAARSFIAPDQWETLLIDVGLAQYRNPADWPPDNDDRTIPAEYLSCLNQAVAFSDLITPALQLQRWSDAATQPSLRRRAVSLLAQQAFKLMSREQALSVVLNAFTKEMNEIRGEDLHVALPQPDGGALVVHYSNLYAYGRLRRPDPQCHVWVASLVATLRLVGIDSAWRVVEVECSCQTLTGHCVFGVYPRL